MRKIWIKWKPDKKGKIKMKCFSASNLFFLPANMTSINSQKKKILLSTENEKLAVAWEMKSKEKVIKVKFKSEEISKKRTNLYRSTHHTPNQHPKYHFGFFAVIMQSMINGKVEREILTKPFSSKRWKLKCAENSRIIRTHWFFFAIIATFYIHYVCVSHYILNISKSKTYIGAIN